MWKFGGERKGREWNEWKRYLRWVFGVDRRTPKYLVKEKTKRGKLRERAGIKAWGFEKRLMEGNELARLCWEEMSERGKARKGSDWEEERRKFFEGRDWNKGGREEKDGREHVVRGNSKKG